MRTTEEWFFLLHRRAEEPRREQKVEWELIAWGAASFGLMVALLCLIMQTDSIAPGPRVDGSAGSIMLYENAGACVMTAVIAFMLGVTLATAIFRYRRKQEKENRQLLRAREESARLSYESLLVRSEEVRMLRHDMEKHFYALRSLSEGGDPRIIRYLDDLIEMDQAIRPIVYSGGTMLNAILNHTLNKAMDQGIAVEILRDQAPDSIALSDSKLCSLVMNVMENALEAASAPGLKDPYIRLDLYTKQTFFFFSCENARSFDPLQGKEKRDPSRGQGLKIIRKIAERNGGLIQIDLEQDLYRIRVALPVLCPDSSERPHP